MKKLSLIIFLFFINIAFTQENIVLDSILKNKGFIFSNIPLNFNMGGDVYTELKHKIKESDSNILNLDNDSILRNDFPKVINFNQVKLWSNEELKSKYLVDHNIETLNFKKVNKSLNITNPEEQQVLKDEINTFNNRFNNWSKFPIYVTRPYFSFSKTYAIIVIRFGNDSGQSILLKKIDGIYQFYTYINNWVY
ncbi:hypothetical protein [Flavobacterium urocaniciphilum]|uniref:Uncharacterized protein n=1 Tax=Flavobacterium urocaniciphilum TaxID=1299341 RepID=A0A1H9B0P5_9FLAO|nr:hypothetical protein [Flavobacterium urocaniciphilum]SEP82271.1 hypothetical protein SAMN05444005_102429 [Flavobacterium urocaniciphilum]